MILVVLTGLFYADQKIPGIKTEGVIPLVRAANTASFRFGQESIEITLRDKAPTERLAVFAYDPEGRQVVIVKPVQGGTRLTIRPVDFADYRVTLENGQVKDFEIFREIPGIRKGVDFFRLLVEAKEASRLYGVQDCLYPICTRCMDVCPVIKQGVIKMKVDEGGAFFPAIYLTACPRSGKCFAVCTMEVIVSATKAVKEGIRVRPAE
jgi:hypothetical protein